VDRVPRTGRRDSRLQSRFPAGVSPVPADTDGVGGGSFSLVGRRGGQRSRRLVVRDCHSR
jgi:hypothetical protein